jgi:hypothetical protein
MFSTRVPNIANTTYSHMVAARKAAANVDRRLRAGRIRAYVKNPCIHRFLWSRLAQHRIAGVPDNEPRPEGAVSSNLSHGLVSERVARCSAPS